MASDDLFHYELAKTLQSWQLVESEFRLLYAELLRGANPELVDTTFCAIDGVASRLALVDACIGRALPADSAEMKSWRALFSRAGKLAATRSRLVHEPVVVSVSAGGVSAVIGSSLSGRQIDLQALSASKREFAAFADTLRAFRAVIAPILRSDVRDKESLFARIPEKYI